MFQKTRVNLSVDQRRIVWAVTFGNILEWFEVYSFAYFAPIIAKRFFNTEDLMTGWIYAFLVFGAGFIARPFGSIIWGRFGDLIGRRKAFISSILLMTIPTFFMGLIPTYANVGVFAPIMLLFLRLVQSIPAAAEAPGTICFLYENASPGNRRYLTSWEAFGNQIGAILGVLEAFIFDSYLSAEFLAEWGWRLSFIIGGCIGLLGLYLRSTLHETPVFQNLKKHHHIDRQLVRHLFSKFPKSILIGAGFGVVNAVTFYLLAAYLPSYLNLVLELSPGRNAAIVLFGLFLITVLLPVFGMIAERFDNRKMFAVAVFLVIIMAFPLYYGLQNKQIILLSTVGFVLIFPVACITALIPFQLAHMYPANIRFTGVGLSFSLADGIVGGFTPAIGLLLVMYTHNYGGIAWLIFVSGLISLYCSQNFKR